MLAFHHISKLWTLKTFIGKTVIQHQTDSKEKCSCFNGNVLIFFQGIWIYLNLGGAFWDCQEVSLMGCVSWPRLSREAYNEEVLKLFILKRNRLGLVPKSLILNFFGHQTFTVSQYSLQRLSKTLESNIWVDSGQREEITIYVLLHLTMQIL